MNTPSRRLYGSSKNKAEYSLGAFESADTGHMTPRHKPDAYWMRGDLTVPEGIKAGAAFG